MLESAGFGGTDAERGLALDHTTIWRWVQRYGLEVHRRLRGSVKQKSSTWHMDETFFRIAGRWLYLFRAVDSKGQTVDFYLSETRDREAAQCFLKKALANPDNRAPHVFARNGLCSYPAAIRELQKESLIHGSCRHRKRPTPTTGMNRTPFHQTTPASDAGTAKRAHRLEGNSSNRGGTHDSQRTSSGNHPAQSSRASLGICHTAGRSIGNPIRTERRASPPSSQLQHFRTS